MKIKWYWWIPVFGIFFTEEIIVWVFEENEENIDSRKKIFSYIWFLHLVFIIIGGILLSKS